MKKTHNNANLIIIILGSAAKLRIDELFLFSGSVVEPVVTFDRQRLDFGAQLLGGLCNNQKKKKKKKKTVKKKKKKMKR